MKSGSPAGTSENAWMRASGVQSYWRCSNWPAWSRASQEEAASPSGISTRTGRVLMNRPTIDSTPGSSAGRPETTAPKTTSETCS